MRLVLPNRKNSWMRKCIYVAARGTAAILALVCIGIWSVADRGSDGACSISRSILQACTWRHASAAGLIENLFADRAAK